MEFIHSVEEKYKVKFDIEGKKTYDTIGCEKCNGVGYYERIGIFEVLVLDDKIKELISQDESTLKITEQALKNGYKPLLVDGIQKVIEGYTNLDEINRKLHIY